MLDDPKFPVWMVYDDNRSAGGGGDFIILAFKVDGVVIVDPAHHAKGEVQIQQAWSGCGTDVPIVFKQG